MKKIIVFVAGLTVLFCVSALAQRTIRYTCDNGVELEMSALNSIYGTLDGVWSGEYVAVSTAGKKKDQIVFSFKSIGYPNDELAAGAIVLDADILRGNKTGQAKFLGGRDLGTYRCVRN